MIAKEYREEWFKRLEGDFRQMLEDVEAIVASDRPRYEAWAWWFYDAIYHDLEELEQRLLRARLKHEREAKR